MNLILGVVIGVNASVIKNRLINLYSYIIERGMQGHPLGIFLCFT